MREIYGGLAAQIVTPVLVDGRVAGIVSLHQLGSPRNWTDTEIEACRATATRVGELI
jgi:GAF domain-containing protein